MRPSAIRRSIACRATSRRNGSNHDRMIAPGVSSTISSTPVAVSSARMLRPSRPMMRPFMSSLGRSTTETVVSMACSAALRWMASAMICWARAAAVSRASVSRRLTRLAASRRASASICLRSELARFVGRQPRDALQLALALGQELLGPGVRRRRADSRWASAPLARAQVALEPLAGGEAVGRAPGSCPTAPARGWRSPPGAGATLPSASAVAAVRLLARFERGFLAQATRRRAPPGASGARPAVLAAASVGVGDAPLPPESHQTAMATGE